MPDELRQRGNRPDEAARTPRVKRWARRAERSPRALWVLFWASFAETIIVPIPIELVLIPFMVSNRHRLWATAAAVTAGCLLAAMVGYGAGYLFFDTLGTTLVEWLGWQGELAQFREMFRQHGFWAIVAIGVTPVPFQVAMLAAGAAGYPVPLFIAAATVARGIRYFGLAVLVYFLGHRAESFWRRHRTTAAVLSTAAVLAILAAGIWL